MTPPDIIIILTDEERAAPPYEDAALTAWRRDQQPGHQWFVDHGVDLGRHYTAATACVPSRPSLFTGHYPDVHGVTQTDGLGKSWSDTRLRWLRPGEVPTMGHWFRAGGYDTHYDGKWHISHADLVEDGRPLATNNARGKVYTDNVARYLDADPLDEFGFSGWVGPEPHGGALADSGTVRDPLIADRVVRWLEDRYARRATGDAAAARPFLLVASFVNPHDIVLWPLWVRQGVPIEPTEGDPPPVPPSPTDDEDLAHKPAAQLAYREAYPSAYGPAPLIRRVYDRKRAAYRHLYHRLHREVDAPIDRVRRAVTTGGSEEAVLMFSSDHGDLLGAHGGLHQKWFNLYDECTRVPFRIVRTGDGEPLEPRRVDHVPTSHVDVLPTLLGLAGISIDDAASELRTTHSEVHPLPGRDLTGLLEGTDDERRPVYLMTRDNMLEGDGSASALGRARGKGDHPGPLWRMQVAAHVGSNFEAVVSPVPTEVDDRDHLWKLVRTFDDPATWTEPHVRTLAARAPGGDVHRDQPLADQWELYDLDADPIEAENLWRNEKADDVRVHLVALLEEIRAERVPERNEPWPYAERPDDPLKPKSPPPPARAVRALAQRLGLHPDDPDATDLDLSGHRALIVCTSHSQLDIGKPTGVFASEMTAPYYVFTDSGLEVDLASIDGGEIPIEPSSLKAVPRSVHDDRFLVDDELKDKVRHSAAITDVAIDDYDIVFLAGGWGAAFDLGTSDDLGTAMTAAIAQGAVIGGVCHGPLGLLRAKSPDGSPFVEGRRLTAVTDKQVKELGITSTPQHPETELRKAGADFESTHARRDVLANHVVVDGDLVTGQNQNAGPMVAREMLERLLARD
jgi:arylsulfatase A-like enzyme/putative intracellular protease/amidase